MIGGFALLWDRIKGLERRISGLEQSRFDTAAQPANPQVTPGSDGAEAADFERAPMPAVQLETQEQQTPVEADATPEPLSDVPPESAPEPTAAHAQAWATEAEPALVEDGAAPQPQDTDKGPSGLSRFQFDFEDIFGRRLPIWAGGIALAISGIFLVRYSIEAGLITPRVRVLLSIVFGLGLIAGAEAAFRFEEKLRDERVRQALAGAGLATLFGSFYLAGAGYGLIGAGAAFIGLAAVTAAAIALSHRFGLPCAIVGLVGGFAAPVLVDSDGANVPLLALYLALVTGGLAWTGQRQNRPWLGYAAMAAGLGWGFLMMLGGFGGTSDILAFGGYLIVLGTVLPAFMRARSGPSLPQLAAGAIATLQMAYLVDDGGYSLLTWGLYLLIAGALAYLGWRHPALRAGSAVAAAVGLWLLAFWPSPEASEFALVAAAIVAIFAAVPLALQWRGKAMLMDIVQLSAVALLGGLVIFLQWGSWNPTLMQPQLALVMAALAAIPAISFWLHWRSHNKLTLPETCAQLTSAGLLGLAAGNLLTDNWVAPIIASAITAGFAGLMHLRQQAPLHIMTWAAAGLSLIILTLTPGFTDELGQLFGLAGDADSLHAILRWTAVAAGMVLVWAALRSAKDDNPSALVASAIAAVLTYGVAAQFVPANWLGWVAAAGAIGVAAWREREFAGWGAFLVIAAAWALIPVSSWFVAALMAVAGIEFLALDAVSAADLFLFVAPAALATGLVAWRLDHLPTPIRTGLTWIVAGMALVAIHSLYKGAWGISTMSQFAALGLGERTVWQALLLAGAIVITKFATHPYTRHASLGLIAASLAHFLWFTLVMHNPLWASQHVGALPIVNWIVPAYGVALAGLVLARQQIGERIALSRPIIDAAMMALVAIMAISLLRQFFAGSLLNEAPIGQTESLLMSLLGIVLALAFLWWGSRNTERSWRVGSLVLMLLAVLKVFLVDAAGLDGLLRIASFMALGFSLIGIGWFYTRQLKSERAATPSAQDT